MRKSVHVAIAGLLLAAGCANDQSEAIPTSTSTTMSPPSTSTSVPPPTTALESSDPAEPTATELRLAEIRADVERALSAGTVETIEQQIVASASWDQGLDADDTVDLYATLDELRIELAAARASTFIAENPDLVGPKRARYEWSLLSDAVLVSEFGDLVIFVDATGAILGHVPVAEIGWGGLAELGLVGGPRTGDTFIGLSDDHRALVDGADLTGAFFARSNGDTHLSVTAQQIGADSSVVDTESGSVTTLPDGCVVSATAATGWYLICDDVEADAQLAQVRHRSPSGATSVLGGPGYMVPTGERIAGHWRYVEPGPGDAVLAQWSGECEVPSAHLLVDERSYGIAFDDDRPRLAEGEGVASWVVGWMPDGRAAIVVDNGPCSNARPGGVYAVDGDGAVELVVINDGTAMLLFPAIAG